MNAVIVSIGVAFFGPIVLETGVHETQSRMFDLPVHMDAATKEMCKELLLWQSVDQGRTWHLLEKMPPQNKARFAIKTSKDGHHWFTLQQVNVNGSKLPEDVSKEEPAQKIYVNAAKRPVFRTQTSAHQSLPMVQQPSFQEMLGEMRALRERIDRLEKRIAELEKERGLK
jgi:hypothetical protein